MPVWPVFVLATDYDNQAGDGLRETLYEYCIRGSREALLNQWDEAENQPITPRMVTRGSKKKVWWQCRKGHRWQSSVCSRTGDDTDCPYCAGKQPWPGETDLATVYPHLAKQWHPSKNDGLKPQDVLPGSHKKVWWLCERGHEWPAAVRSRASGNGCPVCANRTLGPDNSLAMTCPEIARQWHPGKNGRLTPEEILPGSERRVWWQCEMGHEWRASVFSRTGDGKGCPYCTGKLVIPGENDLAAMFPDIASQWHPEKNGSQKPQDTHLYSNRSVWWICERGHTYRATVSVRTTKKSGCPYCTNRKVLPGFNDLATLEPKLAQQWHPDLNGGLTPEMVTKGSKQKVWWQCGAGHAWKAVIYSRTGGRKSGCPVCAGTVRRKKSKF